MISAITYTKQLNRISPCQCWRYAQLHGVTLSQAATVSRLSLMQVQRFSQRKSFADMTLRDIDAFRFGCGITRRNERYVRKYLKRKGKNH